MQKRLLVTHKIIMLSTHTMIPCPGEYSLTSTWLGVLSANTPRLAILSHHSHSHCIYRLFANKINGIWLNKSISPNCHYGTVFNAGGTLLGLPPPLDIHVYVYICTIGKGSVIMPYRRITYKTRRLQHTTRTFECGTPPCHAGGDTPVIRCTC